MVSRAITTQSAPVSSVPGWVELVQDKARGIRFGVIQVTIHDGRVVQIESTEKT